MTNGRSLIATQSSSVFLMVNYTVNFATENGNISNIADVLHANVSKQLNVSVTSGQFTTLLSQSNSSSLQTMTSSVVPIVPAAVIVFVPSSSSSSGQGSSMILLAAIAGGGVAGKPSSSHDSVTLIVCMDLYRLPSDWRIDRVLLLCETCCE